MGEVIIVSPVISVPSSIPLPPLDVMKASLARDEARLDPVSWVHNTLSEYLWSKQRTIIESVRDNRRTAVHSCNASGKSFLAARIACWWIACHPPHSAFVVTTATTGSQVRAILWREIARAHAKGNLPGRLNQTEWFLNKPNGDEEMVGYGRKPSDYDNTGFQGIHAKYVLVIFDEASGIPEALWDAGDTLLANNDSRMLAIGNPYDPVSNFANVCKPGSGWKVIGIDAYETPNFTGEPVPDNLRDELIGKVWVDEKKKAWGENSSLYIARVRGQFPESSTDGLIPLSWIRIAQERSLEPSIPSELGVDVGGGTDKNVIAHRQGPVVRIIRKDTQPNTMVSCGNLISDLSKTGATIAKVDSIGIGRGMTERAQEQGKPVVGIQVGESANNKEQFANLRAEGYWSLRERFQNGEIDIDPDDEQLASQLVDIKYKRTSTGKIQIESKEEMKRRIGHSPDEADAVMLAFIQPPIVKKQTRATWGRGRR